MSVTAARRPQVRVPWTNIAVVLIAAVAAAAVLVLVNQPRETATQVTSVSAPGAGAVVVPVPEGRVGLRLLAEKAATATRASSVNAHPRNFVRGVEQDTTGGYVVQSPAPRYLPGSAANRMNPHPMNLIAGSRY